VRSVNGASVPEPEPRDVVREGEVAGDGRVTAEWEAALRRARVPDREDIEDARDVEDVAVAEVGPGPEDVEPEDAEGVPTTIGDLRERDVGYQTVPWGEDASTGPPQDAEGTDSDRAGPHEVATGEAVLDTGPGEESRPPSEAEAAGARSAVGRAAWAELGAELTRSSPDATVLERLGDVVAEAHRRDVHLADVVVRTGWSERLRMHDYQRPDPSPALVERGANKVWASGDSSSVRVTFSPSPEQSRPAPGLNPESDPYLVTVRDPQGRVVWSQPMATATVTRNEPAVPRLRTDVEQVSEVATRTFRAVGGVVSGGVSELPGVGEAVSAGLDRVGTDRGRLGEDRKTDVPFPAERFTREGYRLGIEVPAHANAYVRDATLVRDLHTRTLDRLAGDGVLTRADADRLTARLERLPWDKVGDDQTTSQDRLDCLRLLGGDGLRQWIDERLRDGKEST
jgi:hypothetical protein